MDGWIICIRRDEDVPSSINVKQNVIAFCNGKCRVDVLDFDSFTFLEDSNSSCTKFL